MGVQYLVMYVRYLDICVWDIVRCLKLKYFHEESLSDPNPQAVDIKSGIAAENLGIN